jgi:hypothetical protein
VLSFFSQCRYCIIGTQSQNANRISLVIGTVWQCFKLIRKLMNFEPMVKIGPGGGGEGVRTSNFTTTTGHFFHYIESVFLGHHYYNIRTLKSVFLVDRNIENQCLFSSSLLRQKFRLSMF